MDYEKSSIGPFVIIEDIDICVSLLQHELLVLFYRCQSTLCHNYYFYRKIKTNYKNFLSTYQKKTITNNEILKFKSVFRRPYHVQEYTGDGTE